MQENHQIDPGSTDSLLACLSLAIDEARLVRSIVDTREQANKLTEQRLDLDRLAFLNRKIEQLETELATLRRKARQDMDNRRAS